MSPIERRIGYKFRNPLLLAEALTHSSLRFETKGHQFDNQRLEFLGDAVLELIVTDALFRRFPHHGEGQLTKMRARIVSQSGLKKLADQISLGDFVLLGKGEEASGGRERISIIADCYEALIGAMYLDAGLELVRNFLLSEGENSLSQSPATVADYNPKGHLQELLQANGTSAPEYVLLSQSGPEHAKVFRSAVHWEDEVLAFGEGPSKKAAECAAARAALEARVVPTQKPPARKPRISAKKAVNKV